MSSDSAASIQSPYIRPAGILSYVPESAVPYVELIRFAKPAGTIYLFIPALSSIFVAASMIEPLPPATQVLKIAGLFLLGSTVFRGAACTWNDILDQDIDRKVTRTKGRPLPRGAISTQAALLYNAVQIVLGSVLLSYLPPACVYYSLPSIILIGLYPLAKRITHYPQVVLSFTWAYGFVIGFPAMGIDVFASPLVTKTVVCLYGSAIAWTILYDMVYAHQDIKDDKREGVKSIAIKFEAIPKTILTVLGVLQISLLIAAGAVMDAGLLYYFGCFSAAMTLFYMILTVDLNDPASCGWWFFRGSCWLTGGSIVLGCFSEYSLRLMA